MFCNIDKKNNLDIPFDKIYHCIILSKISYLSNINEIIKEAKNYSILLPNILYFYNNTDKDSQAFMYIDNNKIFLTFRGTESFKDAYCDIDVRRHSLENGCKIHNGFYEQFHVLKEAIEYDIDNNINNITEINISGHSLGGALATIASAFFGEKYKNIKINCYTFGCPRVGNDKFVNWFHENIKDNWRICNNSDPVPSLPMSSRFYHVNNKINLKKNNFDFKLNDIPLYSRILSSIFKLNINEHHTEIYINRIKTILNL